MPRGVPYPEEMRVRAVELYTSGLSIERVTKALGLRPSSMTVYIAAGPSSMTVYKWIVAAGVNRTLSEAQRLRLYYSDDEKAAIIALLARLGGKWPLRATIGRWR